MCKSISSKLEQVPRGTGPLSILDLGPVYRTTSSIKSLQR